MDTIWNVAFGVDIDLQNDLNNDYFDKCEIMFAKTRNPNFNLFLFASNLNVFCVLI